VRSLIDRDAVVPREGRYVFVDTRGERVDLTALAAPASLQSLIAARLDALSPAERRAVQDASVLGLSFTSAGLAGLTDDTVDVDTVLESLLRKEIFELQGDPRSPERGQYRFLQALVRQVAYDTLSRRDRKSRHLAVAAHLAASLDDTGDLAAVLAQHHLDALDASSSDDSDHAELAEHARALLARAAARAEALGSPAQALLHADAALARGAAGVELHELQELAARNARLAGQSDRALDLARAARAGYTSLGREVDAVRVLILEGVALRELGRIQQAVDLLTPAYEQFRDRPDAQSQLHQLAGSLSGAHVFLGNHEEAQRYGLHSLQLAEAEGDVADVVAALYRMSLVLLYMGSPTASRALLLESIRTARQQNLADTLSRALNNLASLTYPRDLTEALPYAVEALELSEQIGDRSRTAVSVINVCLMQWLAGHWDDAALTGSRWEREDFSSSVFAGLQFVLSVMAWQRGDVVAPPTGYPDDLDDAYDRASVLGISALATAQGGDPRAAVELLERGLREYLAVYSYEDDVVLFWSVALELALEAGDLARARDLLAVGRAAPRSAVTPLLAAHQALYEGLVVLAEGEDPEVELREAIRRLDRYGAGFRLAQAKLSLGTWLADRGRSEEARELLDAAGETFTELRAAPSLAVLTRVRQRAPVAT
jgi:tetratricopeptide (TPR) repeat protein